MSALVLDAGAFVAIERGDRRVAARLRAAERSGIGLRSNGAVVAQVWRDPRGRQGDVARLLVAVDVRPVDLQVGKDAGVLAGRAGVAGAVDATVVAVAAAGDRILTSDARDIQALVQASGRRVLVVPC